MDPSPEHIPKQASHTKPAIEWDVDELLEWIQQKRPNLLTGDKLEIFKAAEISGEAFLTFAGDMQFFKNECKLPVGTSVVLAKLATELSAISKSLSFIPCTPRRQQTNSVAGKGQQSEDVELSFSQSCKSFAPSIS
jgi:hypothetical protein